MSVSEEMVIKSVDELPVAKLFSVLKFTRLTRIHLVFLRSPATKSSKVWAWPAVIWFLCGGTNYRKNPKNNVTSFESKYSFVSSTEVVTDTSLGVTKSRRPANKNRSLQDI